MYVPLLTCQCTSKADAHRIELGPLDDLDSRLLAIELLKKLPETPGALQTLVTDGAEGNPFYMEELVNMLIDKGAIEVGPERWTLHPDRLLVAHVPPTLTGVLQARLDGLPAAERLTLQEASVIGLVFWDQALAAIDPQAGRSLPALVRRALILPRQDASLEGMREYVFRHQILHHVTYDTLLKRPRCELHAKVAMWLAGLTDASAKNFLGMAAEHLELAGETAQACEFYARASEYAVERNAHEAALGYVARALTLIGDSELANHLLLRWRLLDARERTLDLLGRRPEQQADIGALEKVAETMDDDCRRGEAAWRRSCIAASTADFRTSEAAAQRAMTLAERSGNLELGLRARVRLAGALRNVGNVVAGKQMALAGLAEAKVQGLRRIEALFLEALSSIALMQDDLSADLEIVRQTLSIARELGDRRIEASALCRLGNLLLYMGAHSQARGHLEEGLRLTRAIGHRAVEIRPLSNLSEIALWEGDNAQALAYAKSALDIAVAVQSPQEEVWSLCGLGYAELALGRHSLAAAAFTRAQATALRLANFLAYDPAAGLARVALAQGDLAGALLAVEGVLANLFDGGALNDSGAPRLIRLTCYLVLTSAGDPRAADLLKSAYRELQARAVNITDAALRHSFLNNIPEHREIVTAWDACQATSAGQR